MAGKDYLTDAQLKEIMPLCNAEKRKRFLPFLNLAMAYFKINTELRVAMFLAQLAHESTDLTRWVENLNYSAKRLTQVWRNRFPTIAVAQPFANNPQALANRVYNGRMGNRVGSNDGWLYRGRAPMQATGREMYQKLTDAIGRDFGVNFTTNPDLLLEAQFGFLASAWIFAVEKNCLPLADRRDIETCTRRINGGTNGLADRLQNYRTALRVLPDSFSLKSYDEFNEEMRADSSIVENASRTDNQSQMTTTFQDALVLSSAASDGFSDTDATDSSLDDSQNDTQQANEQLAPVPDGSTVQNAGQIQNVEADKAEEKTLEAAQNLPPTEIEKPPPTGFGSKLVGIFTAIFTGQYVVPQFVSDGLTANSTSFVRLLESLLRRLYENRFLIFGGLVAWIIVKKVNNYLLTKKIAEINTDPTKGNVVLVERKTQKSWFQSFRESIASKINGKVAE